MRIPGRDSSRSFLEWRRLEPVPAETQALPCQRCGRPIGDTRVCLAGTQSAEAGVHVAETVYRHEHCPPGRA